MAVHKAPTYLLERLVRVAVVGCGGTGSAVAGGLPYLHEALLAFGHPHGLKITLIDGDLVSETNCVRQPFTRSEVGHPKATLLATRLNLFWGLDCDAVHGYVGEIQAPPADLVIGCVDTRAARAAIRDAYVNYAHYWLDFGNEEAIGQYILGELTAPRIATGNTEDLGAGWKAKQVIEGKRLPHVGDVFPELLDPELDPEDGPSCSAAEALTRQAPFINQVLANHGLGLLSRLFRYGQLDHHGGHVNLETGRVVQRPIPVTKPGEGKGARARRRKKKAVTT
jgi:PRTRC genetic system ThiF family protein